MTELSKPSFSNKVLTIAENFQHRLGETKLGSAAVNIVAGSNSLIYEQLNWLPSRRTLTIVHDTVEMPDDPYAKRFPRQWDRAAVIAVNKAELSALIDTQISFQEALAYISDGVQHVGTFATGKAIFEDIDSKNVGVAVRHGPGPLQYSAGAVCMNSLFYQSTGNDSLHIVEDNLPIARIPLEYTGLKLI